MSLSPGSSLGISFMRGWLQLLGYQELALSPDSVHGSCRSGNLVLLVKLLTQSTSKSGETIVNKQLSPQLPLTPLFFACLESNHKIVDFLLFRHQASLLVPIASSPSLIVDVSSSTSDCNPSAEVPSVFHIVCATGNVALLRKFLRTQWNLHKNESIQIEQQEVEKPVLIKYDPLLSIDSIHTGQDNALHPLTLACVFGHSKVVKCLFNFYQDYTSIDIVQAGNWKGLNMLMLACFSRDLTLLSYLLEHEATAHLIHTPTSAVPLKSQCVLWNTFKQMLNSKAQCVSKEVVGESVNEVEHDLVELLFAYNFSPLILLVCLDWFDAVELLLEVVSEREGNGTESPSVNEVMEYCCTHSVNHTALHWAASCGNCDILDILTHYQFKRQPRIKSPLSSSYLNSTSAEIHREQGGRRKHDWFSNNTALHSAVRNNQLACALRLLQVCPQWVNVTDCRGNLPLHYACLHKNKHLFNALIHKTKRGPHITGENGYTALHFVCLPSNLEDKEAIDDVMMLMSRSLLNVGADASVRDCHDGCTPLQLALEFHSSSLFCSLLDCCLLSSKTNMHRQLLNSPDFDGRTLLHYAAVMNKLELSEKLLKLGANIEAEDKRGGRPLHVTSSARLACFLIESGAQLNAQDAHGLAPLHLAVVQGNVDMIALLLSYPDVNCQLTTSTGMNVLHLACERTPCEGNTALTVLKQLIHNISCFKELDITVSVADAEESNKSVKSAINFAIRPNNDLVSVELLKVLFANGIHSAECDMLLALRCAMRHELISTCTFLLHVFRPQINHEGIKSLLFFAISLAKWPIFQFLLSQLSDKAQDRGSSRDVLMDIEAVQNPFSCIHQVSSQSPPVSFTLLVYPIEWCIVTAAFEHSLEKNRKQKDTEKGIRELQKIFSVIMTHCREHGHKSRSSMHKFDFLTNRSIMSSVLSSASDNQVVLHMLTQWLAFNHMQPSTMIANMRPVRSRGMKTPASPPPAPPVQSRVAFDCSAQTRDQSTSAVVASPSSCAQRSSRLLDRNTRRGHDRGTGQESKQSHINSTSPCSSSGGAPFVSSRSRSPPDPAVTSVGPSCTSDLSSFSSPHSPSLLSYLQHTQRLMQAANHGGTSVAAVQASMINQHSGGVGVPSACGDWHASFPFDTGHCAAVPSSDLYPDGGAGHVLISRPNSSHPHPSSTSSHARNFPPSTKAGGTTPINRGKKPRPFSAHLDQTARIYSENLSRTMIPLNVGGGGGIRQSSSSQMTSSVSVKSEEAINQALQRLAKRQATRQYSATNATGTIFAATNSEEDSSSMLSPYAPHPQKGNASTSTGGPQLQWDSDDHATAYSLVTAVHFDDAGLLTAYVSPSVAPSTSYQATPGSTQYEMVHRSQGPDRSQQASSVVCATGGIFSRPGSGLVSNEKHKSGGGGKGKPVVIVKNISASANHSNSLQTISRPSTAKASLVDSNAIVDPPHVNMNGASQAHRQSAMPSSNSAGLAGHEDSPYYSRPTRASSANRRAKSSVLNTATGSTSNYQR